MDTHNTTPQTMFLPVRDVNHRNSIIHKPQAQAQTGTHTSTCQKLFQRSIIKCQVWYLDQTKYHSFSTPSVQMLDPVPFRERNKINLRHPSSHP